MLLFTHIYFLVDMSPLHHIDNCSLDDLDECKLSCAEKLRVIFIPAIELLSAWFRQELTQGVPNRI